MAGDALQRERQLIAAAREQAAVVRARAASAAVSGVAGEAAGMLTDSSIAWAREALPGYEFQREIHRGGQGVVYLALQRSTGRPVAIKVMKEGPFAGPEDKARFEREVRILGQLKHPSIVGIHDSGTAFGCFYFVMDYIAGPSLDVYLVGDTPSQKDRLRLFEKICEAVNAAHLRGIVHRDLKPSNIRIDTNGHPQVLDFGLARLEEGSSALGEADFPRMTLTGQFVGSLPWASPEQVGGGAGGVDVRSDVYSLGVVLYQVLTGAFPYEVCGQIHEVVQRIMLADPLPPSAAIPQEAKRRRFGRAASGGASQRVDPELETIILKCLSKERERRYQNAGELARDIRHYLAGEPIEAKRDAPGYVLRKLVQRHWLSCAVGATVPVVLLAGLIVSLAFWRQALTAQTELEEALVQSQESKQAAQQVADSHGQMLWSLRPDIIGQRLREDVLSEARAALERSAVSADELDSRVAQLAALLAGVNFTNAGVGSIDHNILAPAAAAIERDFVGVPLVQATLYASVAHAYRGLGLYDEAGRLAERALETRRHELGDEKPETLQSMLLMGDLLLRQGRRAEAETYTREALDKCRRFLGDQDPITLVAMDDWAMFLLSHRKYAEAEQWTRTVLEQRRRLLGADHPDTLECISRLAALLSQAGKRADAEPYYREALERRRRTLGNDSPATLESISALGILLVRQGKFAESEPYCREALEGRRRVLGDAHPDTVRSLQGMALLLSAQGKPAEAESYRRTALETLRHTLGDNHPSTIAEIKSMGAMLWSQGRVSAAEPYLREAVERYRRILGEDDSAMLDAINSLCSVLWLQGKYADEEPWARELLEKRRRIVGDEHPVTLAALSQLGAVLMQQGRLSEAEPYLQEVLARQTHVLGADHASTILSFNNMGLLRRLQGRLNEAEACHREALERGRRSLSDKPRYIIAILRGLGAALQDEARLPEAESCLREALDISRRVLGDRDRTTLLTTDNLGSVLRDQGKLEEAQAHTCGALEGLRACMGDDHPHTLASIDNMGLFFLALGDSEAAEKLCAEAVRRARMVLPAGHWSTAMYLTHHAQTLIALEDFASAESELIEAHDLLIAALGPEHVHTTAAAQALLELHDRWLGSGPVRIHDLEINECRAGTETPRVTVQPVAQEAGAR